MGTVTGKTGHCSDLELYQGDLIVQVKINYKFFVDQLMVKTKKGVTRTFGKIRPDGNSKEFNFDEESYRLFGFRAVNSTINVESLGIIRYNYACLEKLKLDLGDSFTWSGANTTNSSEEAKKKRVKKASKYYG